MVSFKKYITLSTYNVHGLAVNTGPATEFIEIRKPDILVLTETWMQQGQSFPIRGR